MLLAPRVAALIAAHCPPERAQAVRDLLLTGCSTTLPGVRPGWLDLIERIQAGVLRRSGWDPAILAAQVRLARTDWRDLLMAAGFGEDLTAHARWLDGALRSGRLD